MPYYLIPALSDSATEITDLAQKAKVDIVRVQHLYDLAPFIPAPGLVIISIREQELLVLMKNLETLLPEVPTVVAATPGTDYTPAWNRMGAPLPAIDYNELSGKLAKSGLLSSTTKDASDRVHGSDRRTPDFMSQFDQEDKSEEVVLDDDVDFSNEI